MTGSSEAVNIHIHKYPLWPKIPQHHYDGNGYNKADTNKHGPTMPKIP